MTPVNQPNETITIAGKPANYINTGTSDLNFYKPKPYLNYIPTGAFYRFSYVLYFSMSSSSPKTTLVTNSFVNCNYLNIIAIIDANIVNIPEGFAQTCNRVTSLRLLNAGIETIDKNAFKGLINLEVIQMTNNKVSCLPPDLFQTIPNIQFFHLMLNKITTIDSNLFRNLPKLTTINLSGNSIAYLPVLNLTGSALTKNFTIFVPENPIVAIKPDFCTIFDSRTSFMDYIDVPHVKCFLVNNAQTQGISRFNCRTTMAPQLQNCYSNWTLSMNGPVRCEASCPWSFILQQILDYLKMNNL